MNDDLINCLGVVAIILTVMALFTTIPQTPEAKAQLPPFMKPVKFLEYHGRHYIAGHLCFVGWMPDFELNKCRIQVLDVMPQLLIRCDQNPYDDYTAAVEAALVYHASVLQPDKFTRIYYDHVKTND